MTDHAIDISKHSKDDNELSFAPAIGGILEKEEDGGIPTASASSASSSSVVGYPPEVPLSPFQKIQLSVKYRLYQAIVPAHVRRRAEDYPWPTPQEALYKGLGWIEWPYFPWAFLDWKQYPKLFFDDFLAGVTVGVILIPQGMAYALTASLDPIMGLYAGTIAGFVYTLLGTSGQLTIGPVALVSAFMQETFTSMGISLNKKDKYAGFIRRHMAGVLSLAVGIMLIIMGALRLGKLMKFVSPSVMVGFTTGSGVYIGLTQMKYMFGIKLAESKYYWESYLDLATKAYNSPNVHTMRVGWACWGLMFFFFVFKKIIGLRATKEQKKQTWYKLLLFAISASTLLVLVGSTIVSRQLHKDGLTDIAVVGDVPAGFNPFMAPRINEFGLPFTTVLIKAIPLMLLCYMESMAVARKYAILNKYQLDTNQEMWAIGMGCIIASFFTAYPPGGSFSRTALKADLGVKTPLANIFTCLLVTTVITCMTGFLHYVPMAFLGAVICIAVINLLDFHEIYETLWIAPIDFLVILFTFIVTAFFLVTAFYNPQMGLKYVTAFYNTEMGLEYGILASVIVLVWQITSVEVSTVGQLQQTASGAIVFADMARFPEAKGHSSIRAIRLTANLFFGNAKGHSSIRVIRFTTNLFFGNAKGHSSIRVIRLTANLFFGNVAVFRDEFYSQIADAQSSIKTVIVDAMGVINLDLTVLSVFHELLDHARKNQVKVLFANVSGRLIFYLDGYDLLEEIGGEELIVQPLEEVFAIAIADLGETAKIIPYVAPETPLLSSKRREGGLSLSTSLLGSRSGAAGTRKSAVLTPLQELKEQQQLKEKGWGGGGAL